MVQSQKIRYEVLEYPKNKESLIEYGYFQHKPLQIVHA